MSRKTVSTPEPKKSTRAIADLTPSKTKVSEVRGGALIKFGGVDGESSTKDHKG